ncbi:helix-turn-helix domain-containing protein [Mesomycoplasma ovipneumoniae]
MWYNIQNIVIWREKMKISYKPLWHMLVERKMNKEDLKKASGISSNIVARMGKDKSVSLETIVKICTALDCKIEDVVEIIRDTKI